MRVVGQTRGILFVYDADLSLASGLAEIAHRTFRPETYVCNLCKVTYGLVGMKRAWSDYIKRLRGRGIAVDFSLRSSFRRRNPARAGDRFPALYLRAEGEPGGLRLLVGADQWNAATTIDELRALVDDALARVETA